MNVLRLHSSVGKLGEVLWRMAEQDRSSEGSPDNEADSGTQNGGNSTEEGGDQSVKEEDTEADQSAGQESPVASGNADGVLNSNYDSSDGAIPVHRCDRCDRYETLSHAALLVHLSQCFGSEGEVLVVGGNEPRKLFECDVCNMKFSNGANMRRHKMRHTGVKPYECRVCQKRFFRKDHLAEHFTTHTKTLPYHCPICNRGFQRQIAMRAHFQNEHVGQHDMIKSCPLCSYRAGSMKNLRVHFFKKHGIDLDNPLSTTPCSSMLSSSGNLSPVDGGGSHINIGTMFSDSGDSLGARSADNATPPMHFLTPHVEISMADAPPPSYSPAACEVQSASAASSNSPVTVEASSGHHMMNGDNPGSPNSGDSNSNAPSSSHLMTSTPPPSNSITPSISLIPIKQELDSKPVNLSTGSMRDGNCQSSTSLTSIIKVSPLKSLLRDDLKRRIGNRVTALTSSRSPQPPLGSPSSPRPESSFHHTTITSSEQPSDSSGWRKTCRSLQCAFCGISFPDQTLYFLHKGCHSDSNPWKCNICGEQCSNVYEFNSHLLSKSHQ